MPVARGCAGELISPASHIAEEIAETWKKGTSDVLSGLLLGMGCMPYVLGLLVLIMGVVKLLGIPRVRKWSNRLSLMIALVCAGCAAVMLGCIVTSGASPDPFLVVLTVSLTGAIWVLIVLAMGARNGQDVAVLGGVVAPLPCLPWLGFMLYMFGMLPGAFVSLFACLTITLASLMEIRTTTRLSVWTILWRILTMRPRFPAYDPMLCARCDYNLRGLTVPRCPECGEPFAPALLHQGTSEAPAES